MTKKEKEFWDSLTDSQREFVAQNKDKVSGKTSDEMIASISRLIAEGVQSGSINMKSTEQAEDLAKRMTANTFVYSPKNILSRLPEDAAPSEVNGKKLSDEERLVYAMENAAPVDRTAWAVNIEKQLGPQSWDNVKQVTDVAKRNVQYKGAKPLGLAERTLGSLLFPRTVEAHKAGKEASWKDLGLDALENALMAVPMAGVVGMATKGVRAGKVLKALAAATAVPHAMEAIDSQAYSPDENIDRSVYSEGDALIGTATNLAAPYLMSRGARKIGNIVLGKGEKNAARGLSEEGKAQLDQAVKNGLWTKPSKETLDAVNKFRDVQARGGKVDEAMPHYHEMLQGGPTPDVLEAARAQGLANMGVQSNKAANYVEAGFIQKAADDYGVGSNVSKILDDIYKPIKRRSKITGADLFSPTFDFAEQVLKDMDFTDKLRFKNPKLYDIAADVAENYVSNKYGSKRDADVLLRGMSMMGQSISPKLNASDWLSKQKEKAVEDKRKEVQKVKAKDIMSLPDLSDEDREWMSKIAQNPDILKGAGEGNSSKFRNWYLMRGMDLMRGTELFRPTFDVE